MPISRNGKSKSTQIELAQPDKSNTDNNSKHSIDKKQAHSWKAISTVIGCFIWMLYTGSMYTTGAVIDYIGAYFKVDKSQLQLIVPSIILLNCIFALLTNKLATTLHPKLILSIAGSIGIFALYMSSFMDNFLCWAILYVFSLSFSNGCTCLVTIHHGWLWYPESPGLVSGIIVSGFGLSTLIWNNVALMVVNPQRQQISDAVATNVPQMIRTLAMGYGCFAVIAVLMIFKGPGKYNQNQDQQDQFENRFTQIDTDDQESGLNLSVSSTYKDEQPTQEIDDLDQKNFDQQNKLASQFSQRSKTNDFSKKNQDAQFKQAVLSKQFWLIYLMLSLSVTTGFYTLDIYKLMGLDNNIDIVYLTEVGSIAGIFGALRFIWSAALDKYPFKVVYGTLLVFQIFLTMTMGWASKEKWTYGLYVCLIVWCEGGHFVLGPNVLKIIFKDQATRLYGVLFSYTGILSLMLIGLLATPVSEDYIQFYILCGCLNIVALVLLLTSFSDAPFVYKQ